MDGVLWPDAEIQSVHVDYDAVVIRLRESSGVERAVRCEGYISYALCGFWDEIVVCNAEVLESHSSIDGAVGALEDRLGSNVPESGNSLRNTRQWRALVVHLSDGASLEIVAAKFTAD
jgi:hypothetical protein